MRGVWRGKGVQRGAEGGTPRWSRRGWRGPATEEMREVRRGKGVQRGAEGALLDGLAEGGEALQRRR